MNWKNKLVRPMLFALTGVMALVPAVTSVITGEPLNYTFLFTAFTFFAFAVVFFVAGRKSGGGSGPPSA